MQVRKRDGRVVPFDQERITNAILKAFIEVMHNDLSDEDRTNIKKMSTNVTKYFDSIAVFNNKDKFTIDIEEIQDEVERELVSHNYYEISKAYILYRQHRSDMRRLYSNRIKSIDRIVNADRENTDEGRENANIDTREVMGALLKVGSDALKDYNLLKCMSPKFAQYHRSGVWHENDLDFSYMTSNCLYIPLGKLLKNGFNTGHGSIRPPTTIGAASTLTCIVIQSNQNQQFQHGTFI